MERHTYQNKKCSIILMNFWNWIILFVVLMTVYKMFIEPRRSKYTPLQKAYSFGFIDTNPARRVSAYFDRCSPENFIDCQRPQEDHGYPLP